MTVIVAILYIPGKLGGWGHVFGIASAHLKSVNPATGKPFGSVVVMPAGEWAYATLALGSALALFVYPHATTGVFAAKRRDVIRRNAAMLPVSVPLLVARMFPSWFAGIGDSAIIIGALVPAAIMSIAAANLFTRTIALELNKTFSINLQLLGGIWILQTFPAIVVGLYTRWFHRSALIIGWAAGMVYGTRPAGRV